MRHRLVMADKVAKLPFIVNKLITNQGLTPFSARTSRRLWMPVDMLWNLPMSYLTRGCLISSMCWMLNAPCTDRKTTLSRASALYHWTSLSFTRRSEAAGKQNNLSHTVMRIRGGIILLIAYMVLKMSYNHDIMVSEIWNLNSQATCKDPTSLTLVVIRILFI